MKNSLSIAFDPCLMAAITASLKNSELGRLMRALTTRMCGEDAQPFLNNSGLRLAFALLVPAIDKSVERQNTNRANGAKGGRPRKHPATPSEISEKTENSLVSIKKSKKEDLSPTPPIEEKIKKNLAVVVDAPTREEFEQEVFNNMRIEQACMSLDISPDEYRQMARAVLNDWEFTEESDRSYKHLMNSLRIKVRENNRSKYQYHGQKSKTRHDIIDTAAVSAKDYEGPF